MASPVLTEQMPLGREAASALLSYSYRAQLPSHRVSALITLSSSSGASSQVTGPKGIQLADTTVLQRVPASLGIKLMAYKSHGTEGSDRAYNSSFTGLENNQPQF